MAHDIVLKGIVKYYGRGKNIPHSFGHTGHNSAGSISISISSTAEAAAPIIDPQRTPSPHPAGRRHRRFSQITDSPNTPESSTIVVQFRPSPHLPEMPRRQGKKPRTLVEE
jgi:hypothetical protein